MMGMRRALVGMSTGCCMGTNLTIHFIFKKIIIKGKKKKNPEFLGDVLFLLPFDSETYRVTQRC